MQEGGGSSETKFTDVGREIHHQFNSPKKRIGGTGVNEGGGSSEMQFTDFKTATDLLDGSTIFHIVCDILGFILFMHQQIPSVIQDITREFDELRDEYKELESELFKNEVKPILTRRKQAARKRVVKMEIKRMDKLMNCISNLKTAVKSMFAEVSNVEKISLVLGPSPLRALHVYELCFVNVKADVGDFSQSKVAELLSRKAIRSLISRGAGSDSYGGPTKLFLLVKAPSTLNLPLHFLPKREFQLNRKVVPFRLRFMGRTLHLDTDGQPNDCVGPGGLLDTASNDLIWYKMIQTNPDI
ncbi:hypothetical protein F511_03696 [Dorcoceras hygrometricum]|uniref:Uncharacterized protein n=1 Tax=Dorcoceras hygrometricum TaxID=472368 RepID=A0A2Z7BD54_9LAMI|nr:hypothetical protein F511_03696 [Dorcoceras hygrometricum]